MVRVWIGTSSGRLGIGDEAIIPDVGSILVVADGESGGSILVLVRDDDDDAVGIIPATTAVAVREGSAAVAIIPVEDAEAISPVGSAVGIISAAIAKLRVCDGITEEAVIFVEAGSAVMISDPSPQNMPHTTTTTPPSKKKEDYVVRLLISCCAPTTATTTATTTTAKGIIPIRHNAEDGRRFQFDRRRLITRILKKED